MINIETFEKDWLQTPSPTFLQAPSLSQSSSKDAQSHAPSHTSKGASSNNYNSCYQGSEASTYHEEFNSVIPKDDSANGVTLDKILGNSFRMIDLSTMKDLSNELFPTKPEPKIPLARVSTRKLDLPKVLPVLHRKEENREDLEPKYERRLKLSDSMAPKRLASQIENLWKSKHSQRSLVVDRSDKELLQGLSHRPLEQPQQDVFSYKIKKPKIRENMSYSPEPMKSKTKFIEHRRNPAENALEIMSSLNARSIQGSMENKHFRPPRHAFKRSQDMINLKQQMHYGNESQLSEWNSQPVISKHNSQVSLDRSPGENSVRVLQMINEHGIQSKANREDSPWTRKLNLEDRGTKINQWNLFKKYETKFGIKPKEFFGVGMFNSQIESKPEEHQPKYRKPPTPMMPKRSYGEIHSLRVKAWNKE